MYKNAALRFITRFVKEYATTISCYPIYQSNLLPRHTFIFIQWKFFFKTSIRRNIFLLKTMQQTEL